MKQVTEANGYTFTWDTETGTTEAAGVYDPTPAERSPALQREAGGTLRGSTHQGGHLVPARANGPAIPENHFAQEKDLNLSTVKKLENAEYRVAVDPNVTSLYTDRTAFVSSQHTATGQVPDAFLFSDRITYGDGRVVDAHFSFENLPHSQQELLHEEVAQFDIPDVPNPNDGLREAMDPAEYAALMEEMPVDLSVQEELDGGWTQVSFSEESAGPALEEMATTETEAGPDSSPAADADPDVAL